MPAELTSAEWWVKHGPVAVAVGALGAALISSFLTGCVTIFANWLSNRAARQRQTDELTTRKEQQRAELYHKDNQQVLDLQHKASQQELERKLSLRKEAFFGFYEAAVVAMAHLHSIPASPLNKGRETNPFAELSRHTARFQLVASKEALELVTAAMKAVALEAFRLTSARLQIENLSNTHAALCETIKQHSENQGNLNRKYATLQEANSLTPDLVQQFKEEYEREDKAKWIADERASIVLKQKSDFQFKLQAELIEKTPALQDALARALLAIRNELGLPLDEKWYVDFTSKEAAALVQAAKIFQADVKKTNDAMLAQS